jgi:large subunit ribosomal protein L17
MALIELVDYNETYDLSKAGKKKSTRRGRSRRGSKSKQTQQTNQETSNPTKNADEPSNDDIKNE